MPEATKSRPAAGNHGTKAPIAVVPAINRPKLYLDIVGTLLLQEGSTFRLAPFAKEFVQLVRERFRAVFLTSLSRPAAKEVAGMLGADIPYVEYRKALGKSSGLDFASMFYWVDDAPSSRDLMRLAEERCSAQLITVNGKDGVTRATLEKLLQLRLGASSPQGTDTGSA